MDVPESGGPWAHHSAAPRGEDMEEVGDNSPSDRLEVEVPAGRSRVNDQWEGENTLLASRESHPLQRPPYNMATQVALKARTEGAFHVEGTGSSATLR